MNARTPFLPLLGLGAVLVALIGCNNYTIRFEVGNVINAPAGDNTRQPLDVDVVTLFKSDADRQIYREIIDGTLSAERWFQLRDRGEFPLPADQIMALRDGEPAAHDRLVGKSLLSGMDALGGQRIQQQVPLSDSRLGSSRAAIAIFARYRTPTRPLVIHPPPRRDRELHISVGRTGLECTNCP